MLSKIRHVHTVARGPVFLFLNLMNYQRFKTVRSKDSSQKPSPIKKQTNKQEMKTKTLDRDETFSFFFKQVKRCLEYKN